MSQASSSSTTYDPVNNPEHWNAYSERETSIDWRNRNSVNLIFNQWGKKPEVVINEIRYITRDLVIQQQAISLAYRGETFIRKWKATPSAERKKHMVEGLVRSSIRYPEDVGTRAFCGDLTMDAMDKDGGEGFIRLVKAYAVSHDDAYMMKAEDARSYPHPIWDQDMKNEQAKDKNSPASLVWQYVQTRRDMFLCRFIEGTLDSFANIPRPTPSSLPPRPPQKNFKLTKDTKKMFKDVDPTLTKDKIKEIEDNLKADPPAGKFRLCEYCRKEGDGVVTLQCCTKCKRNIGRYIFYCSSSCQTKDWPVHKKICGKSHTFETAKSISTPMEAPMQYGFRFGPAQEGTTRSPALERQVALLNDPFNKDVDYFLFSRSAIPEKRYPIKVFPDSQKHHKWAFEDARYMAIMKQDEGNTAKLVEHLVCRGVQLSKPKGLTEEDIVYQLRAEFPWYTVYSADRYRMAEKFMGGRTLLEEEGDTAQENADNMSEEHLAIMQKDKDEWAQDGSLDVLKRAFALLSAGDDSGKADAQKVLDDWFGDGDPKGVKERFMRELGFR